MAFAGFVFAIILILIIVLFALILTDSLPTIAVPNNTFASQVSQANSLQEGFSSPVPVTCPNPPGQDSDPFCRGNCLFYETFSQEAAIVNNLSPIADPGTGQPAQFACLDGFIQALSLQTSTCNQDICVGQDGQTYLNGQSEQFYVPCGGLTPCTQSFRDAIVLNFQLGPNDQPNLTSAQCIAANAIPGTANVQFVPSICPNSVSLESTTFLNVIPGVLPGAPSALAGITGYQISAPGTDLCLQVNADNLVTQSCLEFASQGFSWFLFPGLVVRDLTGAPVWNYPQQFINADGIFFGAVPTLESLATSLPAQISAFENTINSLPANNSTIVQRLLGPINSAIISGNCSEISAAIANLNNIIQSGLCPINVCPPPLPPGLTTNVGFLPPPPPIPQPIRLTTSEINALNAGIAIVISIQRIFEILGTGNGGCLGVGITSLQSGNNGTQLVLGQLGSCPSTDFSGNPVLCPFSTQLISGQSWNCTAN